jgi:hypothetical protein
MQLGGRRERDGILSRAFSLMTSSMLREFSESFLDDILHVMCWFEVRVLFELLKFVASRSIFLA